MFIIFVSKSGFMAKEHVFEKHTSVMISNLIHTRVPYYKVDRMGYLFYGYYPLLYEKGRTELLRKLGIPNSKMEQNGILLPALSINIEYIKPVHYDEYIDIETSIHEIPHTRFTFYHKIYHNDNEVNKGASQFCFVDATTRKPVKAPLELINAVKQGL
jgi:acyl-CoA thioester hydrolase